MPRVVINGCEKEYPDGILLKHIAEELQPQYENDIVLFFRDSKLQELYKRINRDCTLVPVTTDQAPGMDTYRRSVQLLLTKAIYDVSGHDKICAVTMQFSMGDGLYIEVTGDIKLTEAWLAAVKERMSEIIRLDLPIKKRSVNTDHALEIFHQYGMLDKERLFNFRRVSRVNLYSINEFEDYHYGYMVPSTGYLKVFDLRLFDEGLILQLPVKSAPKKLDTFGPRQKLFEILKTSKRWAKKLNVDTVGALNECIVKGGLNDLVMIEEALMEKRIGDIAETIASNRHIKFVMIAGPSSSGKTTFSHRLSIQLRTLGLIPHPIALDNYFVNRNQNPKDEWGNYDYEGLQALDVELFNKNMLALLNGERIEMPHYNFKKGIREYTGDYKQLGADDILVLEGIHGLNNELSYSLPNENKFKIYISALTSLNIDEHNRIPSTDNRLVRRIVRDARTRGANARDTIKMWPNVGKGEISNIFPYQEEADAIFNSSLIYELSVLKIWAEPVLFAVPRESPEYVEAKRLLKFLDYFLPIDNDAIPNNSLIREFIGGSCFE